MKNQYFGDQRDYFKYGLLRHLTLGTGVGLCVCWMLTPDDTTGHGQHLGYLKKPERWRHLDPELYHWLGATVGTGERAVSSLEQSGLLPAARFFDETVPDGLLWRGQWFDRFLRFAAGTDVIFFDPDNGFQVDSTPMGRPRSSKYLAWSELKATVAAGHSALIYQHVPPHRTINEFIEATAKRVLEELADLKVPAVTAVRVPGVIFFLVAQGAYAQALIEKVGEFARVWTPELGCPRMMQPPVAKRLE